MTDKAELRRAAKLVRAEAAAKAVVDTGYRLAGHFVAGPLVSWDHQRRPVIAAYWPFGSEIDTQPLMAMAVAFGFGVALPIAVVSDPVLRFRLWEPTMALEPDSFGMQAPPMSAPFVDPDIVIVPALAFDARGNRLGYGKGCYDATLRALRRARPIIAALVAYDAQEMSEIPVEPHDERVDWIVTESAVRQVAA